MYLVRICLVLARKNKPGTTYIFTTSYLYYPAERRVQESAAKKLPGITYMEPKQQLLLLLEVSPLRCIGATSSGAQLLLMLVAHRTFRRIDSQSTLLLLGTCSYILTGHRPQQDYIFISHTVPNRIRHCPPLRSHGQQAVQYAQQKRQWSNVPRI